VVAVRGALITLALMPVAHAEDATATAQAADAAVPQMVRSSSLAVGAGYVSKDSFKAGEYNGLENKGGYVNANLDLHGGTPDSAERWNVTATDLGLETRNIQIDGGTQGGVRINFGYDELLRNRSDTYQTPFLGAGTNNLTLPSTWLAPLVPRLSGTTVNARGLSPTVTNAPGLVTTAGVATPTLPTPAQVATATAIQAADLPAFHNVDLYTKRQKYNGGISFNIDPQWEVKASASHEHKDGMKPMGTVSRATAEVSTIIPDLIDQDTNQFNASLAYTGDKSFMKLNYYGSLFKNNVSSMSWRDYSVAGGGSTQLTISSAPSNEFHKLGLNGGYNFSPTTKLVASGSYARNTQNEQFVTDATDFFVPATSLNGLVVTKTLDLKLTSRPSKDLNLAAGYKYNDRDNRTPVNIYGFTDAQNPIVAGSFAVNPAWATALNAQYGTSISFPATAAIFNLNANRPYSKKVNDFNLDADYRVAPGQTVAGGFDWNKTENYCNGTWIACADAANTDEKTLKAEWRANIHEDINARVAYEYSKRTVDYNENAFLALVPMANVVPTGVAGVTQSAYGYLLATGLTGYGPVAGYNALAPANAVAAYFFGTAGGVPLNNVLGNATYANANVISELIGMRRFNMADRNRDKLRSSLNWQANEKLTLQGGLSYNKDDYANSTYGLQNAKDWTLNLEADYAASDTLSFTAFATHEDKKTGNAGNTYTANNNGTGTNGSVNGFTTISGGCFATIALRNASNKTDPCNNWTVDTHDKVDTIGLAFQKKGLMGDKLNLAGDLSFSKADSAVGGTGGNYINNPLAVAGAPAGTIAAYYIAAQDLPTVTTKTIDLRLNGLYTIDKQKSVRVGYGYQYMKAVDWAYDGMQFGGLAGGLPTNEQAPNYKVHTIAVAYIYTLR
jgi:MtrB/PioB family decaheme-associated outer membrane protein